MSGPRSRASTGRCCGWCGTADPELSLNALTNTDYLEVDQPGASPWLAGIDIDDFADSVPAAVSALGFDAISPSHTHPDPGHGGRGP